jgi:hypothetical protein
MRTQFPTRQLKTNPPTERAVIAGNQGFNVKLSTALGQFDSNGNEEFVAPTLFRFLVGKDEIPVPMTVDQVRDLGDAFTVGVLLKGASPNTLRELHAAIGAMPPTSALPLRKMFLVAEGARAIASGSDFDLNARLVFTWQRSDSRPADLLLSTVAAADDAGSLMQVIAWSDRDNAFHFFERKHGSWIWAGNSFNALNAPTRGKGPFDSHINGSLVMKELKAPWSHWHSMSSSIGRESFPIDSEIHSDPLFSELEGAEVLENIVRAGVRRWTKSRVSSDIRDGVLHNVRTYARQLLWCTSINLVSTPVSLENPAITHIDLPSTFFFDAEALEFLASEVDPNTSIVPSSLVTIMADLYRDAVRELGLTVSDDSNPPRQVVGDTPFAFLVPERAFEDQVVVTELVARGALSARLALCLLLVDFSNPVFSPDRAALIDLFPDVMRTGAGGAAIEEFVVQAARAGNGAPTSPEARFLTFWDDASVVLRATNLLRSYHAAVSTRLQTASGVKDLVKLADSRREAVRTSRSLFEFKATMAKGLVTTEHLAMSADGSVFVKKTPFGEGEL